MRLETEYRELQAQPPPDSQVDPDGEAGMEREIHALNEQLTAHRQEMDDLRNEVQRLQDGEQSAQQLWQSKK